MQNKQEEFSFSSNKSLEDYRKQLKQFADERDWNQYHTPRNVLLSIVGEVGELAEIFQWKGEVKVGLPEFSEKEKIHVGEEISDIMFNLIRFADRCKIDLPIAADRKFQINREKYPPDVCKGSNKKYNEYESYQQEKDLSDQQNNKEETNQQ